MTKLPGGEDFKYDPTNVQKMIDDEKKRRFKSLEGKQADRKVKIINTSAKSPANLKEMLFELDKQEIDRLQTMRLSEEKMEVAEG